MFVSTTRVADLEDRKDEAREVIVDVSGEAREKRDLEGRRWTGLEVQKVRRARRLRREGRAMVIAAVRWGVAGLVKLARRRRWGGDVGGVEGWKEGQGGVVWKVRFVGDGGEVREMPYG